MAVPWHLQAVVPRHVLLGKWVLLAPSDQLYPKVLYGTGGMVARATNHEGTRLAAVHATLDKQKHS